MQFAWPKGFPHPFSLLRTLVLFLFYAWTSNFLARIIPISKVGTTAWLLGTWIGSAAWMAAFHHCLAGFLLWILSRYPQSFIGYQELKNRLASVRRIEKWNRPTWDSWEEGINALIISVVAAIIAIASLVYFLYQAAPSQIAESQIHKAVTYQTLGTITALLSAGFASAKFNKPISEVLPDESESLDNAWVVLFCVWLVSVILLYQCSSWVRSRRKTKQAAKPKTSKKKSL